MDEKLAMKASLLDKLIEKIMGGAFDPKEESEMPQEPGQEPKAEMKVLEIEAEPKLGEEKEMDC
jgi:hypothetical protein